ncbi:Two-component sensor histidine kinase, contains HisKA and HATPase domains [Lishizhenia tianjinensis]|uniref:histidine kinase n=1 Tax=Lishizhenia tianjinensis TaxID=477690 RepID=A0A1I6ZX53_9FLAO|nr:histidine kinase dimerization/phosphoacceptor domain -containing protein [Lishizhenia tianjinensis]SFT67253.1 Two-component sensor histidine kinase, contains HisKA and HATPase domains [Lishizhenia tianjinensis]
MLRKIYVFIFMVGMFTCVLGQDAITTATAFKKIEQKDLNYLLSKEWELKVTLDSVASAPSTAKDSVGIYRDLLSSKILLAKEEYSQYINLVEGFVSEYENQEWLLREYSKGLALSYYNVNLFDEANKWTEVYRELNENVVNSEGKIHLDYIQPGLYYYRSGNYEKALVAFKKNFAEIEHDDRVYDHYKGNILNNIAITYTNLRKLDSAEFYLEKSREYWSKESPDVKEDRAYLMGLLDGNLATIENLRGNYQRAKELILHDVVGSKEKDYWNHLHSRCQLIELQVKLGEVKEARQTLDALTQELDSIEEPEILYSFFLEAKFEVLKAEGDFKEALEVHEAYYDLKFSDKKKKDKAEREQIAVLFDIVSKENLLKEQEIQILEQEEVKARNKRLVGWVVSFMFIGVLLIVTLVLITQLKNRKIASAKERQESIKKQIEIKDVMMREMHHRIKNNLQTVSGLFRMQMRNTNNAETIENLKNGVARVNTITEIHNLVFEDGYEEGVNAKSYLNKVISRIQEIYSEEIQFNCEIEDILLENDKTVPVGLILNELITNSVKYAFKGGISPVIDVRFYKKSGKIVLYYADNGVGYTETRSADGGLGLTLIEIMAKQLKADINYLVAARNKVEFIFE